MIHQCYHKAGQEKKCFANRPYQPFGLTISTNDELLHNCPELFRTVGGGLTPLSTVQKHLCEYAAMLWHWRNPWVDADPWIGFSSYRQTEKTDHLFASKDEVAVSLDKVDLVAWCPYRFVTEGDKPRPVTILEISEWCHPGITDLLCRLLWKHNQPFSGYYGAAREGFFCNYWATTKPIFMQWMEWSWPMVKWCLENQGQEPYLRGERAIAYLCERLFLCWCSQLGVRARMLCPTKTIPCRNPYLVKV